MSKAMERALRRYARFLENQERSPITIKNYLADLRIFSRWLATELEDENPPDVLQITPLDLRRYKRYLLDEREHKPKTVNRHLASLRSFLGWARDAKVLPQGPALKIPRPARESRAGPRWLTRRERNALIRAVEARGVVRDMTIIKFLLHTGIRVGELCALRWCDIQISARRGQLVIRSGKGEKRRVVPINGTTRETLRGFGYSEHRGRSELLFPGQRGPLTPRGVQFIVAKYARAAKLEEISPHSLRHTFCKGLIDGGAQLQEVAALAGHETLETTRLYCEPSIKDLERTVDLLPED